MFSLLKKLERKRKRPKLNSQQFPNILSPSATCWPCWIHVIATCSLSGYFPKIVEWSFLQQGRSVWRKIPGKKRKPFVTGFTNKLQITEAMKKFGRISEISFGEFWDKNASKCALPLLSFPFPSFPARSHFPLSPASLRHKGASAEEAGVRGRKDPKNKNAGSGVESKIFRRDWIDYFRH